MRSVLGPIQWKMLWFAWSPGESQRFDTQMHFEGRGKTISSWDRCHSDTAISCNYCLWKLVSRKVTDFIALNWVKCSLGSFRFFALAVKLAAARLSNWNHAQLLYLLKLKGLLEKLYRSHQSIAIPYWLKQKGNLKWSYFKNFTFDSRLITIKKTFD